MTMLARTAAAAVAAGAAVLLFAGKAAAFSVLVVDGMSTSASSSVTRDIVYQLKTLQAEAGNTVTVADATPMDLSAYDQVWDVRYSAVGSLTGAERAAYLDLLDAGKGLFLVGENASFADRNAAVLSLVADAGGGALGTRYVSDVQSVEAPFDGPAAVGTIEYLSPNGLTSAGSGRWITRAGASGTGVAWGSGALSGGRGTLAVMMDANVLQWGRGAEAEALVRNLIGFMDASVTRGTAPVPLPAPALMLGLGLASLAGFRLRPRLRRRG
ncbi:hypothetical protein P2H44_13130 [Albimonas sp. CAU 1670]|uniref:hypothetical protein n=1 Tax=Albimonas sp. CAU 1670 TaxID=3032599 RepID=UPI0023DCE2C2|nr:hypothetical protein [Albimonas sp. CAU 1670]MDF2233497.1 hypothetical protein [Albimonas sp. CAU 1670]